MDLSMWGCKDMNESQFPIFMNEISGLLHRHPVHSKPLVEITENLTAWKGKKIRHELTGKCFCAKAQSQNRFVIIKQIVCEQSSFLRFFTSDCRIVEESTLAWPKKCVHKADWAQDFKIINSRTGTKRDDEEIKDGHMELDEADLIFSGRAQGSLQTWSVTIIEMDKRVVTSKTLT